MTDYRRQFDAALLANAPQVDSIVSAGDGDSYYALQYVLDALLSVAEATGDGAYVQLALTWAENMISRATVKDKDGFLSWKGAWKSPYAELPICYQISELQACTELARLAWVINQNDVWKLAFGSRAAAVLEFVLTQHVNKQLNFRGFSAWVKDALAQQAHAISDKVLLILTTLAWLDPLDKRFTAMFHQWLPALKARFAPFGDGLSWDQKVFHAVNTTDDTSHANRVPALFDALWRAGDEMFSDLDRRKLAKLLSRSIWNGSTTDPRFTEFADGFNPATAQPETWRGVVYLGWVKCAAWHPEAMLACESLYLEILDGKHNPSIDVNSSFYGLLELPAQLLRAKG